MDIIRPNYEDVDQLVAELHQSDWMTFIATTGAAGSLVQDLWAAPGSSNTIIGSTFLYSTDQLDRFIGGKPHKGYCSRLTARKMAAQAYAIARRYAQTQTGHIHPVVGLGMTAAVGTTRPKKGAHRVRVAVQSPYDTHEISAEFAKDPETGFGRLDRRTEGYICDLLALEALLTATHVSFEKLKWHSDAVIFEHGHRFTRAEPLNLKVHWSTDNLLLGVNDTHLAFSTQLPESLDPKRHIIFPGSFNPLHYGHEEIVRLVKAMNPSMDVVYQMTTHHPVKGDISRSVLLERAEQLQYRELTLLMSGGGLYIEKARLLPGFSFLVGADAVMGLLDKKFYGGKMTGVLDTLEEFKQLGTRFFVAGREIDGDYMTCDMLPIPPRYHHLFVQVEVDNDIRISSTELRKRK